MGHPLIITSDIEAKVKSMIAYGYANPLNFDMLLKIAKGKGQAPATDPERMIMIPHGYMVTYTHEIQTEFNNKYVYLLHISVLLKEAKYTENYPMPNEPAMLEILKLFGFKHGISKPNIYHISKEYFEKIPVINVYELRTYCEVEEAMRDLSLPRSEPRPSDAH